MSFLKQKAKTLQKWIIKICGRDVCVGCPISKHHNCDGLSLVRLEDAQPFEEKCLEYAKLVAAQAEKYAQDKQMSKQKLRELWKHSIVLKGGNFLAVPKEKFEELLKEEGMS
jgi:hypothetical protein